MRNVLLLCLSAVVLSAVNPAANMKLVFSDEFNGAALDSTKWSTLGDSGAATIFKDNKSSCLRISMVKDGGHTNGVTTQGKFSLVYGYFEASIRMNAYKGQTGAIYLHGQDGVLGNSPAVIPSIRAMWGSWGDDDLRPWAELIEKKGPRTIGSAASGTKLFKAGEASSKFNTYGFLWSENGFAWYLNGKQILKSDRVTIATPLVLSVSRYNPNNPQVPDPIDIDWVKVWK
jgi:beta-glucanase (GH16 family)